MELRIRRSDELTHWGIKGQKWGVRRYQNEDGSLTEEGKKHYMTAARKGKLDPKKLSDKDLDMINNRFAKEQNYNNNTQRYRESTFSYKAKQAIISRIKGDGGGGGKKGGGKKGGSAVGNLLGMPIKKAFEQAFAFDPNKGNGGGKDDYEDTGMEPQVNYKRYKKNGHRFVENFKGEKPSKKDLKRWQETGSRFVADNRSSEDILRERHKPQPKKREKSWEEKRSESERAARRRERETEERASKSGIIIAHRGTTHYVVRRVENNDELVHFGIKGQKWGVRRFENADGTLTAEGKIRYGSGDASNDKHAGMNYRDSDSVGNYVRDTVHKKYIDAANNEAVWKKHGLGQDTVGQFVEQKKYGDMVKHITESTKDLRDAAVKAAQTATKSRENYRKPGPLWENMNKKSVEYWDKFQEVADSYISKNFSNMDQEVARGVVYWWFIDW